MFSFVLNCDMYKYMVDNASWGGGIHIVEDLDWEIKASNLTDSPLLLSGG